jgi:uncharacterized protein
MQSVNVVFHIDESEKWPLVLANVRNLTHAVDVLSSDIQILVNSKAVSVFDGITLPAHTETIAELAHLGVQFAVCIIAKWATNSSRVTAIIYKSCPSGCARTD